MTAHAEPSMRHSMGTSGVLRIIMPATMIQDTSHMNQNRLKIFGTSLKKFDRSTSFFVAPQVMLYEKRCARMACDTGMDSPPKKKKLHRHDQHTRSFSGNQGRDTHKKGTQRMFVKNDVNCKLLPVSSVR